MAASERKTDRWIAAFVAIVASVTACQALVTFAIEVPVVDGGSGVPDVQDDAPPGPVDPCGDPPPQPTGPTSNEALSIVFAAYRWGFDIQDAGDLCDEPGRNIDGIDTQAPPESKSCESTGHCKQYPKGLVDFSVCDRERGIDNMARAIPLSGALGDNPFAAAALDTVLTRGALNILIVLGLYNGTENDPEVIATFYASSGMVGGHPNNLGAEQLQALEPVWDGGQDAEWIVDKRSVNEGISGISNSSPRFTGHAYVSRGMLVVEDVDLGFGLPIIYSSGSDSFRYGRFIAKIVNEGDRYKLTHARLSGALSSQTLLATVGASRGGIDAGGKLLCDPDRKLDYLVLKSAACRLLDLGGDGGDIPPPNLDEKCAYASFGFQMAMVQSRIAMIDGGEKSDMLLGSSGAQTRPPCADYEAGTVWCDDCAWDETKRCEAGLPPLDAGTLDQ
jgi:hypothetical protein